MIEAYQKFFGTPGAAPAAAGGLRHIFSPDRVCPLGAHVDHQHGLVTGFAIDKGVDLVYTPTDDGSVELRSLSFEGEVSFSVLNPTLVRQYNWGDYARGAKFAMQKRFDLKRGIKGVLKGSLPVGGLSSSAAVLIAYVMAFAEANDIRLNAFEVMKIASEGEREYIGLSNGLLDQACIALGKKDNLLMLDCDSDEYRLIPRNPAMPEFEIGIFFSGLTRNLQSSDYNLRVSECRTAAWCIQAYTDVPLKPLNKTYLRDVPKKQFDQYKDRVPERFVRRAEHFYTEYRRVREGVTAWESGNIEWFGSLVNASCESSIHNYECGSPELIAIHDAMIDTKGIYGGRFSGAGFKGACVALVNPARKEEIQQSITERYLARFPQYRDTFQVWFVRSDDGARFIQD